MLNIPAGIILIVIIGTSEEHVSVLRINFYYHIAVRTLRTLVNIMQMITVVCHEVTNL